MSKMTVILLAMVILLGGCASKPYYAQKQLVAKSYEGSLTRVGDYFTVLPYKSERRLQPGIVFGLDGAPLTAKCLLPRAQLRAVDPLAISLDGDQTGNMEFRTGRQMPPLIEKIWIDTSAGFQQEYSRHKKVQANFDYENIFIVERDAIYSELLTLECARALYGKSGYMFIGYITSKETINTQDYTVAPGDSADPFKHVDVIYRENVGFSVSERRNARHFSIFTKVAIDKYEDYASWQDFEQNTSSENIVVLRPKIQKLHNNEIKTLLQ